MLVFGLIAVFTYSSPFDCFMPRNNIERCPSPKDQSFFIASPTALIPVYVLFLPLADSLNYIPLTNPSLTSPRLSPTLFATWGLYSNYLLMYVAT